MATLFDIQTKVSQRLLDPDNVAVSSESVVASINDSIAYWKFRRFWFNQIIDSSTMVPREGTIPLPDDFLVPFEDLDGFQIEYGQIRHPLQKVTTQEYDAMWVANGYGLPRWYARMGRTYEVYPLPDKDYVVRRNYLKEYPPLSNPTHENDFTIYASSLLTLWSCANLIAELKQDDKMESYFRKASQDEYRQLQVMTDKSNGTGRLTLSSTLLN